MTALLDPDVYVRTLMECQPRPIRDDSELERSTALLERMSALQTITPEQQAALQTITPEQQAVAEILVTLIEAYEEEALRPQRLDASTPRRP
jgi:hypothetical protein